MRNYFYGILPEYTSTKRGYQNVSEVHFNYDIDMKRFYEFKLYDIHRDLFIFLDLRNTVTSCLSRLCLYKKEETDNYLELFHDRYFWYNDDLRTYI